MTATELQGIAHELNFWKEFVKTPRFLNGWVAPIRTPELQQEVYDFIHSVPNETVMDVGSGVVSILRGSVNEKDLVAVDPLGELYKLVFDYEHYGIKAPLGVPAEELLYEHCFDIVHISNALDHTQNPYEAVQALYRAVKPGGYLIMQGFEREGTFENWRGFHKWDIFIEHDILRCTNQEGDLTNLAAEPFKVFFKTFENKTWYIWIQQKP